MVKRYTQASKQKYPNANEQISSEKVRLVDENGTMIGVVTLDDALGRAKKAGLDLVEVSPNTEPPVCKILNFGKYKYELQKKESDQRKKQKVVQVKEIKLRPTIDQHDYDVKLRNIIRFLNNGDKVKISLRFRGREITHQELGMELLHRIKEDTQEVAKVDFEPKLEGRQLMMVLGPR